MTITTTKTVVNNKEYVEIQNNGVLVAHFVAVLPEEIELPTVMIPSIEEQILAENQYQTMLLELTTLGGI